MNNAPALEAWNFPIECLATAKPHDVQFVKDEFTGIRTPDNYQNRIEFLGFDLGGHILDAGCGMGQWSLTLAKTNASVVGIDKNQDRIKIAEALAIKNKAANLHFQVSALEKTNFPDQHFDAIFCYSVIMFTHIPSTLAEFNRILKPNGKLYVMTDLWPWQLVILKRSWKALPYVLFSVIRSLLGFKSNIAYGPTTFNNFLLKANFTQIKYEKDGEVSFNENNQQKPIKFYESQIWGLQTLAEFIATKAN